MSAIIEPYKLPAPAEPTHVDHFSSDVGYADAIVGHLDGTVRFCPDEDKWLTFDADTGWRRDESGEVVNRVVAFARSLRVSALEAAKKMDPDPAKKLIASRDKLGNVTRIENALKVAQVNPLLVVRANELDADHDLVGVNNGIIDLSSGQVSRHDKRRLVTRRMDCDYVHGATAPTWNRFLERVQPDPEMRAFLARLVGYCMHGAVREHILPFHYGTGSNGKGTFLEQVFLKLFGSYGAKLTNSFVYHTEKSPPPYLELAGLCGKRLALGEENEEGGRLGESLLKAISGGDRVKGRFHYASFVEYSPTYKIQLVGNHKPRITGTDEGIWRRFVFVTWPVHIADEEKDHDLPMKLTAEMPGILNWAIAGARDWLVNGLQIPACCRDETASFRKQSDELAEFISECFTESPGSHVTKADAFAKYLWWADTAGLKHPKTKRGLGVALANRGWNETKLGHRKQDVWLDFKLANHPD